MVDVADESGKVKLLGVSIVGDFVAAQHLSHLWHDKFKAESWCGRTLCCHPSRWTQATQWRTPQEEKKDENNGVMLRSLTRTLGQVCG